MFVLQCKPEQVQAIQDSGDERLKREHLVFRVGDIITVLDKRQDPIKKKKSVKSVKLTQDDRSCLITVIVISTICVLFSYAWSLRSLQFKQCSMRGQ